MAWDYDYCMTQLDTHARTHARGECGGKIANIDERMYSKVSRRRKPSRTYTIIKGRRVGLLDLMDT